MHAGRLQLHGFYSTEGHLLQHIFHGGNGKCLLNIGCLKRRCVCVTMQDFMGFLHIGWDLAIAEDLDEQTLTGLSPAWEAASKVC